MASTKGTATATQLDATQTSSSSPKVFALNGEVTEDLRANLANVAIELLLKGSFLSIQSIHER